MLLLLLLVFIVPDYCSSASNNNCPSLLITPPLSRQQCEHWLVLGSNGCRVYIEVCETNSPLKCHASRNEIHWHCASRCEPTCANSSPICNADCARAQCQCRPGFVRDNSTGQCVRPDQCRSAPKNNCQCNCSSSDKFCVEGVCRALRCKQSTDCPDTSRCDSNDFCIRGKRECSRTNDCPNGERCIGGDCVSDWMPIELPPINQNNGPFDNSDTSATDLGVETDSEPVRRISSPATMPQSFGPPAPPPQPSITTTVLPPMTTASAPTTTTGVTPSSFDSFIQAPQPSVTSTTFEQEMGNNDESQENVRYIVLSSKHPPCGPMRTICKDDELCLFGECCLINDN